MSRLSILGVFIIFVSISVLGYGYYITRIIPKDFPIGSNFTIEENESLRSVSYRLENEHYVNSALWFRVWVSFLGRDRHMQLGNYEFDKAYTLGGVVKKILLENPAKPLIQITVPEGSNSLEIANLVHILLKTISVDTFNEKVLEYKADGKLFPSTYFLLPSNKEEDIVKMMTETFEKKYISAFRWTAIPDPLKSRDEVIVLASILEGEAKTEVDMHIVAGILLSRLKKNMPLQVDVDKDTYKNKGLPSSPLNNPGIMALSAVLKPTDTDYLFYLTGKDGEMYYAKTFTEHKQNIRKYLR